MSKTMNAREMMIELRDTLKAVGDHKDKLQAEVEWFRERSKMLVASIKDLADAGCDADAVTTLPVFKELDTKENASV